MSCDEKIFKLLEGLMFGTAAYCRFFEYSSRWMSVVVSIELVACTAYAFKLGLRYEWREKRANQKCGRAK